MKRLSPKKILLRSPACIILAAVIYISLGCIDTEERSYPELEFKAPQPPIDPSTNAFSLIREVYPQLNLSDENYANDDFYPTNQEIELYESLTQKINYSEGCNLTLDELEKIIPQREKSFQQLKGVLACTRYFDDSLYDFKGKSEGLCLLNIASYLSCKGHYHLLKKEYQLAWETAKVINHLGKLARSSRVEYLALLLETGIDGKYFELASSISKYAIPNSLRAEILNHLIAFTPNNREAMTNYLMDEFQLATKAVQSKKDFWGDDLSFKNTNPFSFHTNRTIAIAAQAFQQFHKQHHNRPFSIQQFYDKEYILFEKSRTSVSYFTPNGAHKRRVAHWSPIVCKMALTGYQSDTSRLLTILSVAARVFKEATGDYPENLSELSHLIGPTSIEDIFAEKPNIPLFYDKASKKIWSVGDNFKNDNGDNTAEAALDLVIELP